MDMVDINSKEEAPIMKVNGEIIKCRVRDNLTLSKVFYNIRVNGKQINIMDGELYIAILL